MIVLHFILSYFNCILIEVLALYNLIWSLICLDFNVLSCYFFFFAQISLFPCSTLFLSYSISFYKLAFSSIL